MLNINEADNIYFSQVKQYFKEVTTSYEIGNYRSAIVMLYAVVVCDLLLKLEELVNTNNDGVAREILNRVETTRTENQTSSQWEWELIKLVRDKTNFLDNEAYANIEHLYAYRNMCAHPAVNDQYELFQPSKELTIAFIKNTVTTVLIKPPIYIKKVIHLLTEDISEKSEIFVNSPADFKTYLDNKYYNRMSLNMKLKTIKALWKFVFILEDDECSRNRRINFWALLILSSEMTNELVDYIKNNGHDFGVSPSDNLRRRLINYLSRLPQIWKALDDDVKYIIKDMINKDNDCRALSWFMYDKEIEHLNSLGSLHIDKEIIGRIVSHYRDQGMYADALDFCIKYFGESGSFDSANNRFRYAIFPYLKDMTCQQIEKLIATVNSNDQLYNRWDSVKDNSLIVYYARKKHGGDLDYSSYKNFKYLEEQVNGSNDDAEGDPQ